MVLWPWPTASRNETYRCTFIPKKTILVKQYFLEKMSSGFPSDVCRHVAFRNPVNHRVEAKQLKDIRGKTRWNTSCQIWPGFTQIAILYDVLTCILKLSFSKPRVKVKVTCCCFKWLFQYHFHRFLFTCLLSVLLYCPHQNFTYSTALLYTSMALSVSPASRWTFPSIMKVLSCLLICRAMFRCSSAWQRQRSQWSNHCSYENSLYCTGLGKHTYIFEVFNEEIT